VGVSQIVGVIVTMELSSEFSLENAFAWNYPINTAVQVSIAAYGCDEDRIHLASHFSVSSDSLDKMSLVPSAEVRLAVASNPTTPPEALMRLIHDHDRAVRAAANETVAALPEHTRAIVRSMPQSRIQRLKARISA
jgi:Leucine rich repeat variant